MDKRPIGIIDSGSGGLSIWKAIVHRLSHESTVYLGDHAQIPYSDKTEKFIRSRVVTLIHELTRRDCKLCVIACNTATVAGIDWYRSQFPTLPIVGVVPVIKTAAAVTKTNHIIVFSTEFTAKSAYLQKLISLFAGDKQVISLGSSTIVPLIESPDDKQKEIQEELKKVFAPYIGGTVDVIVLGCTHYPFIRDALSHLFDGNVSIIDSGDAVSRQVTRVLTGNVMLNTEKHPTYTFFTTGNASTVSSVMSGLLKQRIVVEPLLIP